MWKLEHIVAKNILTFMELDFVVSQNVATFIFGENRDDAGQGRNGSGKSSLIEAIAFGIIGDSMRGAKTEEIINDSSDDADISLFLRNDYDNTTFEIHRHISRKDAQIIQCAKYDEDGNEIERENTVQPTVADYNRYILEEIGLSRDDLYNCFILNRKHYKPFLDASDKDKKELINFFSNAVLVDESIERLHKDMEPVLVQHEEANAKVVSCQGAIDALQAQIDDEKQHEDERKQNKAERIERQKEHIAEYREKSRNCYKSIDSENERLDRVDEIADKIEKIEKSDDTLVEAYQKISKILYEAELPSIRDYQALNADLVDKLDDRKKEVVSLKKVLEAAEVKRDGLADKHRKALAELEELKKSNTEKSAEEDEKAQKIQNEIDGMDKKLWEIDSELSKLSESRKTTLDEIERLERILKGTVTCPECGHKFLLDEKADLEKIEAELAEKKEKSKDIMAQADGKKQEYSDISDDIKKKEVEIASVKSGRAGRVDEQSRKVKSVGDLLEELNDCKDSVASAKRNLDQCNAEISKYEGSINNFREKMFDEAYGITDDIIDRGEKSISRWKNDINTYKSSIAEYEKTIKMIEESDDEDLIGKLNQNLDAHKEKLNDAKKVYDDIDARLNELKLQEQHFVGFKSYLANQKIDAIADMVNEFLEAIGSNIRVVLEGFKTLKSGKVREKITVSIERDGVDCGSFVKFSEGEKARVNLATILALQKLCNVSAPEGKGLGTLVLDEILDSSDEVGLMSYSEAINKLGITALVVTQGAITEGYAHQVLIVKEGGVSNIVK